MFGKTTGIQMNQWTDQENEPPLNYSNERFHKINRRGLTERNVNIPPIVPIWSDTNDFKLLPPSTLSEVRSTSVTGRVSTPNHRRPIIVTRRNERERNRVKLLNLGFERLRSVVPSQSGEQLSKISTLKKAIWYIEHLDRVLHGQDRESTEREEEKEEEDASMEQSRPVTPPPTTPIIAVKATPSSRGRALVRESASIGEQVGTTIGTASWLSPENTTGVYTNAGGRPVKRRRIPSPVFPPHWETSVMGEGTTSTPKVGESNNQFYNNNPRSPWGQPWDSGYSSLRHSAESLQRTVLKPNPEQFNMEGVLQQRFLDSLENLLPFYNRVRQPVASTPSGVIDYFGRTT